MKAKIYVSFLCLFVAICFQASAFGAIRIVGEHEAAVITGKGCGDMHCVVHEQGSSPVSCEDCCTFYCSDPSWDHADESCEDGPPDECDGHYNYQSFSETTRTCGCWGSDCGTLKVYCNDQGTENSGGDVYLCY